jgi:zinc D-Ala-D-Ala carboxypeptidase
MRWLVYATIAIGALALPVVALGAAAAGSGSVKVPPGSGALDSPYFTLQELTKTSTGLPNVPNAQELENLRFLTRQLLDPLRAALGEPLQINSGFRSQRVNDAVGGSSTSDHRQGLAADVSIASEPNSRARGRKILATLRRYNIPFDQLIWYTDDQSSHVHLGIRKSGNRREILRKSASGYSAMEP